MKRFRNILCDSRGIIFHDSTLKWQITRKPSEKYQRVSKEQFSNSKFFRRNSCDTINIRSVPTQDQTASKLFCACAVHLMCINTAVDKP